jgi:hypothetical protein
LADVYRDAAAHNVTIVGGSARTVGAAGGYLTGGGHSPLAHFYGLAVDSKYSPALSRFCSFWFFFPSPRLALISATDLLEVAIVTPTGQVETLNKYTDPDYFWAVRGGAGSSWGVIVNATYQTHPLPAYIQVVAAQFNLTAPGAWGQLLTKCISALADITDAGYVGYIDASPGFQAIFNQANGTNATYAAGFGTLLEATKLEGVSGVVFPFEFPDFLSYASAFVTDPHIATNDIDASRLLTRDVLKNKSKVEDLVRLIEDNPDLGPGFNFGKLWAFILCNFFFFKLAGMADDSPRSWTGEGDRTKRDFSTSNLGNQPGVAQLQRRLERRCIRGRETAQEAEVGGNQQKAGRDCRSRCRNICE